VSILQYHSQTMNDERCIRKIEDIGLLG